MIRCLKDKRSVLISVYLIDTHVRKFHLASKSFAGSVSHRNQHSQVEEKNLEIDSHPSPPENSNVNFLGIEGDEGVITVSSKISCLQEKTSTKQSREKFYQTSYGVIRYDTDNKIKFHGQYGKRNDYIFPHHSSDISEVSRNISEMTPKTFDKLCNDYNKSSLNAVKKSELLYEEMSNEMRKENSLKDSGEVSYIDQFYFETIPEDVERKETLTDNYSTDELNYLDKEYFGHCIESEKQNLSPKFSKNISFKEKSGKKIDSDIKEDTVNNPSLSSSTEDLNFMDKNYFGESTDHESQKSCHVEEIFQNTLQSNSTNLESNHQNLLIKSTEENKSVLSNSNFEGSQKSISRSKSIKGAFNSILQSNVNASESFDRKQISVKNSEFDLNIKQLDSEMLRGGNELNFDSVVEKDFLLEEKHTLPDRKTKINPDSNQYSHVVKSNFPKLTKPSQIEKNSNDSGFSSEESTNIDTVTTAYDFVKNLHKQQDVPAQKVKEDGNKFFKMKVDSKGFRILKDQVEDLSHFTRDEIISLLKQSILYQDDNLLILNKPYSLVIHDSQTTKSLCLSSFLEDLAKEIDGINFSSKLVTVHRLDKETTGCLLIARNEIMAQNLQSLFAQRKIIKKYWVLTSKVPDPPEGLIDIPISEGSVNSKKRMVLNPEIPKDTVYRNHSKKGKQALTSYKVLSESGNAALVEVTPITGVKHQIRVHFGFGLSCPIIGDHKYSHLDKLAPQKLPSDILQRLYVRQSKVRHIPLHIHAKSVTVPGYFEGQDLYIQAPLPNHMKENLKKLKFKKK